jgi:hypothetical protein
MISLNPCNVTHYTEPFLSRSTQESGLSHEKTEEANTGKREKKQYFLKILRTQFFYSISTIKGI